MTRLAIRLLQLVRRNSDDDPLVGDLLEEHLRRNSPLWLWKQVTVAIAATMWARLRVERDRLTAAGQPRKVAGWATAVFVLVVLLTTTGFLLSGEYVSVVFVSFGLFSLTGGAAIALVRFVVHTNDAHQQAVPDAFARDGIALAPLNLAQVRVAGLGGAALVFVATCVAIEIHAIGTAMLVALAGGVLCGAALIFHRTHQRPAAPTALTR